MYKWYANGCQCIGGEPTFPQLHNDEKRARRTKGGLHPSNYIYLPTTRFSHAPNKTTHSTRVPHAQSFGWVALRAVLWSVLGATLYSMLLGAAL